MKKVFLSLAVVALLAACGAEATTTEVPAGADTTIVADTVAPAAPVVADTLEADTLEADTLEADTLDADTVVAE